MEKLDIFLKNHGMLPHNICPSEQAEKMCSDMKRGLRGEKSSMPMIPTYLKSGGKIPKGKCAAVIDAGGTNFRSALVSFNDEGYKVEQLKKVKMPGTEKAATWDEFISFTADNIMPLMDKTDSIGFCFSYSAEIQPDIDGKVCCIDKEVVVEGCEGKLIGRCLNEELRRRGIPEKRIVILNDTAAVLLGGSAILESGKYSDFIGQVSGTGTNTCCNVRLDEIGKLGINDQNKIIVNTESGFYDGLPMGDFDRILDGLSNNPGQKLFEKMTAGVYLGKLSLLMIKAAAKEGFISEETGKKAEKLGQIDSSYIDSWSKGERLNEICAEQDNEFVTELCRSVFQRSALCMCTNLAALLLLTGGGKDSLKPVCICAEGSLVQKSLVYRETLQRLIREEINSKMGLNAVLVPLEESTLPGSAAAVLLNP